MSEPRILAIDASSTAIGWVLWHAGQVQAHGEHVLLGADIADRCRHARDLLFVMLERLDQRGERPDALAIESPVARYGGAVIAQARVSGALLALASQRGIFWCEISPTAAKKALTNDGRSGKQAMQEAAQAYGVGGEHAADAVGVAKAAAKIVQVLA